MESRHRIVASVSSLIGLLLACGMSAALASSKADRDNEDSNALIMTAEIALQRNDCGRAAANYTVAAQRLSDAKLAARAAAVSLDCGQYINAERSAARWRALTPADPAALRASMRAELGLYKIDDARSAFEVWLSSGVTKGADGSKTPDSAQGTVGKGAPGKVADDGVARAVLETAQESGVPATLAMVRGLQSRPLQSGAAQLALADLALDGWNYREAQQYAEKALSAGADRAPAQLVLARAHAGLGEADQAEAAASAAKAAAPTEQSFASADVLLLLGREREARSALEALVDNTTLRSQAQRRLGLLAFNSGDFDEAQRDFSSLLNDRESAAIAVYYLSAIAERRDDVGAALRGYELLGGTALEAAARARAADLLYKQGDHDQALKLLAATDNSTPAARLESEIAQAQLLSNAGEGDQALARIDDALARFPNHPDLLYQRAILLEKASHTDQAVEQLESLYKDRPQDGAISNALGFILADHNRDLSRSQKLIEGALKVEPDNPAILDSLGWLLYRRGMARDAATLLERAFRLDQDGDIGAHWGEVLWSLGDKSRARDAWNRALIVDPDNALVKAAEKRAGVPQLPSTGTGTSI